MKLGLLLFPAPRGSAQLACMAEGLGFDSVVFADTQNITPEVWGQLMLAARDTERIELGDSSLGKIGRRPVSVDEFERYVERLQGYLRGEEVDRDGTPSRLEWYADAGVPKVPLEIGATGRRVIEV